MYLLNIATSPDGKLIDAAASCHCHCHGMMEGQELFTWCPTTHHFPELGIYKPPIQQKHARGRRLRGEFRVVVRSSRETGSS